MIKIGSARATLWVREAWDDWQDGMSNLFLYGMISGGLWLVITCCSSFGGGGTGVYAIMGLVFSSIISVLGKVITEGGLLGVALARLHGRHATEKDYQRELSEYIQLLLVTVAEYLVQFLFFFLFGLPGIIMIIGGVTGEIPNLVLFGFILTVAFGYLGYLVGTTFTYFASPLVVDKNLDFWTALSDSMDCAYRDFWGILKYRFIVEALIGTVVLIITVLTCGIAAIFVLPLFAGFRMRAYQDYFGLAEDRYRPIQVIGHSTYHEEEARTYSYQRSVRDEMLEAQARQKEQSFEDWRQRQEEVARKTQERLRQVSDPESQEDMEDTEQPLERGKLAPPVDEGASDLKSNPKRDSDFDTDFSDPPPPPPPPSQPS